MRFKQPKCERLWLVGGGLAEPWTFGDVSRALAVFAEDKVPMMSVAQTLLQLTRTLLIGNAIDLGEGKFAGEGQPAMQMAKPAPAADGKAALPWSFRPDAVIILRTSGSTGIPTVVRHRVCHLWRNVVVGPGHRDDVWGFAFNPAHIAGVQVYLQALANGNTLVNLWGLSAQGIVDRCIHWGVTHLSATPTFYRLLLASRPQLPALRSLSLGGEQADSTLMRQLKDAFGGVQVRNIYASTEAGSLFVAAGDEFEVPARLVPSVRCEAGRLWLHRALLGEANLPSEWHDTGDRIKITSTAPLRFRIIGRGQGWINVGGEKVDPREVETVLQAHPAIAAARVHGRSNSVTGKLIAADVVPRGAPPSLPELNAFLAAHLPPHKHPRFITFVDTLDLGRTGKLLRDD